MHHIIPRSLGGNDEPSNLCLLCANCHRLVHSFAVGRRLEGPMWQSASQSMSTTARKMIAQLAMRVRDHHARVLAADNTWVSASNALGPVPMSEALTRIVQRNGYGVTEKVTFLAAAHSLLAHIPDDVRAKCSFRLLKSSRYLSVNAGNQLALPNARLHRCGCSAVRRRIRSLAI
jgi:hypothetical protein